MNLSNASRTDLEMLHIIQEATGPDDWATSDDIAAVLGISSTKTRSRAGRVAPRLSWMARFGLIRRVEVSDGGKGWQITDAGRTIMSGKLRKPVSDALDASTPGDDVLFMRKLMQRQRDDTAAVTIRREYLHHVAQRNGH